MFVTTLGTRLVRTVQRVSRRSPTSAWGGRRLRPLARPLFAGRHSIRFVRDACHDTRSHCVMTVAADKSTKVKYRWDYAPPPFLVDDVELEFALHETATRVTAALRVRRNPAVSAERQRALRLDRGKDVQLVPRSLQVDDAVLDADAGDYTLSPEALEIHRLPSGTATFTLRSEVVICPRDNTALEGLYVSGGNFCTQCEAEGFRRITFFIDRPDVMARYRTRIVADRERYPVLLCNGNLVESGAVPDDASLHYAVYEDPWRKPCYLFALVAGKLVAVTDSFTRAVSGRPVDLRLYVRAGDEPRGAHAMASLKRAMRWDEEVYGREYDLDVFNIVAVDDFNMGAMENKSLNLFNSKYVLASASTATDADYHAIEGVVGHEYFHNWSGNRVTCRDWFQLSLKEGFTVFRDQEFSADMLRSRAVQRIVDVMRLRSAQFPQDAGPMAHPVRPDAYEAINNFYSVTVYEKGAEVIRMLRALVGVDGFRRGTDLYFERHDGQAVTCDDFVAAIRDANPDAMDAQRWEQFLLWYSQAGTPEVRVLSEQYDAAERALRVTLCQRVPPTPGQPTKRPHVIPVATGLLGSDGREVTRTQTLLLTAERQEFCLRDVPPDTVSSYLRGFSAPVKLFRDDIGGRKEEEERQLAFLMAHDTDDFNRWEAAQTLLLRAALETGGELSETAAAALEAAFDARAESDPLLLTRLLTVPSEGYVADEVHSDDESAAAAVDPVRIHAACGRLRRQVATRLRSRLQRYLQEMLPVETREASSLEAAAQGRRALINLSLAYLVALEDAPEEPAEMTPTGYLQLALERSRGHSTMTGTMAALSALANTESARAEPYRQQALDEFYQRWQHDYLVVDKWLRIQSSASRVSALEDVERLAQHDAYNSANPNNVYSLLGGFALANPYGFHGRDDCARAYRFIADQVLQLDERNPQVAARIATAFLKWRRYDPARQSAMREQMERIRRRETLSADVNEILTKALQ